MSELHKGDYQPDIRGTLDGIRVLDLSRLFAGNVLTEADAASVDKKGDTVAALFANTPAMLEAHHGVPMTGAVLNTMNTRLDAATIAFPLDHGEAKFFLVDQEFAVLAQAALALATNKPLIAAYNDPGVPSATLPDERRATSLRL